MPQQQNGLIHNVDITHERTNENISYQPVAPETPGTTGTNINYTVQFPGIATARVNITRTERDSAMVSNHVYEKSEGLYEHID